MTTRTHEPIFSSFADDPDMLDLIEMFVDDAPEKIEKFEAFLAEQNWSELRRIAHQLKGSAGGYGFEALMPCAQQLEHTLDTQFDASTIPPLVEEVTTLLSAIRCN